MQLQLLREEAKDLQIRQRREQLQAEVGALEQDIASRRAAMDNTRARPPVVAPLFPDAAAAAEASGRSAAAAAAALGVAGGLSAAAAIRELGRTPPRVAREPSASVISSEEQEPEEGYSEDFTQMEASPGAPGSTARPVASEPSSIAEVDFSEQIGELGTPRFVSAASAVRLTGRLPCRHGAKQAGRGRGGAGPVSVARPGPRLGLLRRHAPGRL